MGHNNRVLSVSFSPDGKQLASGSSDETIKVWEVSSGKEIDTLRGHKSVVFSVSFSPDGKQLASGSDDETIKVWELSSGKEIATLRGHNDSVWSVDFSPDGKQLASGGNDKTRKVWDLNYLLNYLWLGLDSPYQMEDVKQLIRKVEKDTGFVMDGIIPVDSYIFNSIGPDYLETGDYLNHEEAYENAGLSYSSGYSYLRAGEYNKAKEKFEIALKIRPNFLETLNALGWLYFITNDHDKSKNMYKKAIEIYPDSYENWHRANLNSLGWGNYLRGDYELAMIHFKKAVEFDSKDLYAHFNIALTHLALKEFKNSYDYFCYVTEELKTSKYMIKVAIEDIDELLQKNPELTFAYLTKGYLYKKLDNKLKAEEDISKFINDFKGEEKWKDIAKELLLDK